MVFIVDMFWWGLLGPSCNEMSGNCFCTVCHYQYATLELNMIKFTCDIQFNPWINNEWHALKHTILH